MILNLSGDEWRMVCFGLVVGGAFVIGVVGLYVWAKRLDREDEEYVRNHARERDW